MYRFSLLVSLCVHRRAVILASVCSLGGNNQKRNILISFLLFVSNVYRLMPRSWKRQISHAEWSFLKGSVRPMWRTIRLFPFTLTSLSLLERERENFRKLHFLFFFSSFLFLLIFLSLDGWLASVTCLESPRRMNHERWPSGRAVISCRNYCFSLLLLLQGIPHIPDALENSRSSFLFLSPWLRRATIRTATLQTRIFVRVRIYAFWVDGHISRSGFVPDGVSPSFISFFFPLLAFDTFLLNKNLGGYMPRARC